MRQLNYNMYKITEIMGLRHDFLLICVRNWNGSDKYLKFKMLANQFFQKYEWSVGQPGPAECLKLGQ